MDWNLPPIPPVAGKRYVRRDGKTTGVITNFNEFFRDLPSGLTWFADGHYICAPNRTPLDLIEDYAEPVKIHKYANIYKNENVGLHDDETKAKQMASPYAIHVALPVTISEGHT